MELLADFVHLAPEIFLFVVAILLLIINQLLKQTKISLARIISIIPPIMRSQVGVLRTFCATLFSICKFLLQLGSRVM